MEIIFLLILISLVFVGLLATVLFWAVRSGQFDDIDRQGHQILMDDDGITAKKEETSD